jgi:hypothetical protein
MISSIAPATSLEQLIDHILSSRQITRQDQRQLLARQNLTTQEQTLINRLFDRLRLGFVRVVD